MNLADLRKFLRMKSKTKISEYFTVHIAKYYKMVMRMMLMLMVMVMAMMLLLMMMVHTAQPVL